MDTHRLKYFLHVADEGSINRAAGTLGVAQPALSRQIRLLEEDLGVTLFRRTARGVQLTEEGERLRAGTAAPLRQLELALRYVGSPLARIERGLHIGLPTTAAPVLATPLLDTLSAVFPKVDLRLSVANTDVLVDGMLKGAIDIAMINPVPDGRIFHKIMLLEDLVVIGGPDADLHADRPIEFSELVEFPLILPSSHIGIRTTIENAALRLKFKIVSRMATDSLQVTKDLIEAGHGYAVLPLCACAEELRGKRLRHAPLREPLTHQLGVGVTGHLELPRGFATKVSEIFLEESLRLIKSGAWAARPASPQREV